MDARRIAAYYLVRIEDGVELGYIVDKAIREDGWQPLGGPFTERGMVCQALVQYED